MSAIENVEKEYKQVQADLAATRDQLKAFAEKAEKDVANTGKLGGELKAQVDEALANFNKMSARVQDMEQKLEKGQDNAQEDRPQSLGELIVNADAFKGMNSASRGTVRVQAPRNAMMTVPATLGDNTSQTNSLITSQRVPGILMPGERRLTVRDLIAPGTTETNNIEYVRETGYTNNSRPVSEGQDKPYSDITFELENAPVRTIAHLFKASRQLLDDASALRSYIDARARYGLQLTEENQLLYGNGTGQNLHGIVPQAAAFDPAFTPAMAQGIDRIRLALLQAVLAEFPSTGIVLNPIDWAQMDLTKDAEGRYIIANPANTTTPRLWNLPVVETTAMVSGQFLVGAFNMGAQIFDRLAIEVLISTENDKDFERNLVSIRAEERLALAVYRPEAFVTGSVNA